MYIFDTYISLWVSIHVHSHRDVSTDRPFFHPELHPSPSTESHFSVSAAFLLFFPCLWSPLFHSLLLKQWPMGKKSGMVVHAYNSSAGNVEAGGSHGACCGQSSQTGELQIQWERDLISKPKVNGALSMVHRCWPLTSMCTHHTCTHPCPHLYFPWAHAHNSCSL